MDVKQKSDDYLLASQLLINKKQCLHCSVALAYYSVFLYMKFLLAHVKENPIPYSSLEYRGDDAHAKVREAVMARLGRIKQAEWRELNARISSLHNCRVLADYSEIEYDLEYVLGINAEADSLKKKLKYYYNNLLEGEYR